MPTPQELETQIKNTIKQLAELTDKTKTSEFFRHYLNIMSKFHQYSSHNQLLILIQTLRIKITPTKLMGFRQWQHIERHVTKNQKGIAILVPIISTYDNHLHKLIHNHTTNLYYCTKCSKYYGTQNITKLASGFKAGYVFDISQTQGNPLPEIEIKIAGDNAQNILNILEQFCQQKNISIQYKNIHDKDLYGYSTGGSIVIKQQDTINTKASTLIHEIAHELLHKNNPELTRQQKEIQAEAISYAVCTFFGIDAKSFNYLALYDADYKKIMENLEVVSGTSRTLIEYIKSKLTDKMIVAEM